MNEEKIKELLLNYSFEDLAKSFFLLNLWLPNIASPIKSQLLYAILESIANQLPKVNKITEYTDFKRLIEKLLPLLPSFPFEEDYIPENDWGEIKYFFNDKFYHIFYGGDLSNPYDYYYSFEAIHKGFEDFYISKMDRSAMNELQFCLSIQDVIINHIDVSTQNKKEIDMGWFELPSEDFWEDGTNFLDSFDPTEFYDVKILNEYTEELEKDTLFDAHKFIHNVHTGENCQYFFLKKDDRYFPVLPRRHLAILIDKWGEILDKNYLRTNEDVKIPEIQIGTQVYHFIKKRFNEDSLIFVNSAFEESSGPHKTIFTTAVHSRKNLFVIHILPPSKDLVQQQKLLDSLDSDFREAYSLLSTPPTRIAVHGESRIAQFASTKNPEAGLEPVIFVVIPTLSTSMMGSIGQPIDSPWRMIMLDQLLGILDEVENFDDLTGFLEYTESHDHLLGPMNGELDKFGAYKDGDSILIPGASDPTIVALDPNWGSRYRYNSLSEFWSIFPEENFFVHPRSWLIKERNQKNQDFILKSRQFFGFIYCHPIGPITFYINSPVQLLNFEQGKLTDLIMGSLGDAVNVYKDLILQLSFAKLGISPRVFFFPLSLVKDNSDFRHLSHLVPSTEDNWAMDITSMKRKDYGVRVVFDDKKVFDSLNNAKDRSAQIELLTDILLQIDRVFSDKSLPAIIDTLNSEKTKKNRFRLFTAEKNVSFPDSTHYIVPESKDSKLADKKLAEIARNNGISEGDYEDQDAKDRIDALRKGLIDYLENAIQRFGLAEAIPTLIENIDTLVESYERKTHQIENSLDQDVDYERGEFAGKDLRNFSQYHKDNRYLIEKFVQLQPSGGEELSEEELRKLLAIVDIIQHLYFASDALQYDIQPGKISIDRNYLVGVNYPENIQEMQSDWAKEQAQIKIGIIGDKDKEISLKTKTEDYMYKIDTASQKDLGFSWTDLLSVQKIMSLWSALQTDCPEQTYYKATLDEIKIVCLKGIKGITEDKIELIVDFLTLSPAKILVTEDGRVHPDLPVGEHRKRSNRYGLRCVIKIDNHYYWGPHSVKRAMKVWMSVVSSHKLPADITAPEIVDVLRSGHIELEEGLQERIKEVVLQYTPLVETEIHPYKLRLSKDDIGDIDVFGFLKEKNIILNIESKTIDQVYSNKDLKRISEKIFGRTKTTDGTFEEGYLHKVEKREKFLLDNGKQLAERYWGPISNEPTIVSIFVTPSSYWWTKYPPVKTNVHFVELRLLSDFIKNLIGK